MARRGADEGQRRRAEAVSGLASRDAIEVQPCTGAEALASAETQASESRRTPRAEALRHSEA